MRIHNLMKNIFIGLFVFIILFIPKTLNAKIDVAGDTEGLLNSNSTGSYFTINKDTTTGNVLDALTWFPPTTILAVGGRVLDIGENEIGVSLHSANLNNPKLSVAEFNALKAKLTQDGSPIASKITIDNISRQNSSNVSVFVYDPTENNPKNGDSVNVGYATKRNGDTGGEFYTAMKPALTESAQANRELNIIDKAQGRPEGSTITEKNNLYNERLAERLAQEKLKEATAEERAAQAELKAAQISGDPNRIAAAILRAQNAENAANTAQSQYDQSWAAMQEAERRAAESGQTNEELGAGRCDNAIQAASNSFYCMTVAVAKFSNIIFKLVSFIAYITGTLFDFSLEFSINSAEFLKSLGVIEVTWSFIRDVLNMTFIFILLWTAVQILIGNEGKYNAQKMLRNVIIVAILMNFSLFAAKLMVDGSNIVTLKIYEAMKASDDNKGSSISTRIMNTVGLTTLYDVKQIFNEKTIQAQGNCATNPGALITISVMGSIFLIIICLALGLAAILFLVRLVNIIILLIKSPLWVWGHVLPGSKRVSELKDKWWSEMMHVLTFPIMYMLWMLVAVIVFDNLRKTSGGGDNTSLIKLVCEGPGAGGLGDSISLVAIFAIVIIFMMKAIEYGFKNAGGGGPDSFGSKFSSDIAKRFSGYQTAVTRGLAKKAGGAVVAVGSGAAGLGIGAARGSLKLAKDTTGRVGGGLIGGASSRLKGKGFREGFGDGYLNPEIARKEALRDMAKKTALSTQGSLLDTLGLTSAAAKLAAKHKEPTNSEGETRKKANERRSTDAVADEKARNELIEEEYKALTHEKWKKENPSGSDDDYQNYVDKKIAGRLEKVYGPGIALKHASNGQTHLKNIQDASIRRYEVDKKDEHGNVMRDSRGNVIKEQKIRLDEVAMKSAIKNMSKDEEVKGDLLKNKKRGILMRNIRSEARVKALDAHESEQENKAKKKQSNENKTEDYEKTVKLLRNKVSKLPSETDIEGNITRLEKYAGPGDSEKPVMKLNTAIQKRLELEQDIGLSKITGAAADQARENSDRVLRSEKEAYVNHYNKQKSELVRKESALLEHKEKMDELEKNK
jgi:hypothetical protein